MVRALISLSLCALVSSATAQTCSVMETQKLLSDAGQRFSRFGSAVAIAGDVIVVGRQDVDGPPPDLLSSPGSAEVFEFNGSTWQRTAILRADPIVSSADFGVSVQTDGTVILVGSSHEDFSIGGPNLSQAGAVYVFEKINGVWTQTQRLTSNLPEGGGPQFGRSMDLDGNLLVIGEPRANYAPDSDSEAGAVHVFARSGNTFAHEVKLQVPEASFLAQLGQSVATDNGIIVAGAWRENGGGNQVGSAYVFGYDDGWVLLDKLQVPAPSSGGNFGWSVDINDNSIAVGALSFFSGTGSGSVFTYELTSPGDWSFAQQFNGTSTLSSDNFGYATHFINHDTLAVGATLDDDGGPQTGSTFLFKRSGGVWTQEGTPFGNADRAAGDMFGYAIDSDDSRLVISAIFNDNGALQNGTVHVLDLVCTLQCPGDIADDFGTLGADGMVSFGDFLALLGLIGPCPGGTPGCTGDIADDFGTLNGGDGMISFGDFLALLGLIGPCP